MEQKNTNKKEMNFFRRLKKAIFELEDYGYFFGEKLTVAFKYFFILVFLLSIIITVATTYEFSKMTSKAFNYIEGELPDFEYSDGVLKFGNVIEGYDNDYSFRIFIDTTENLSEEKIKEYKNRIFNDGNGILLLNKNLVIMSRNLEIDEEYKTIFENIELELSNKNDLIQILNQTGKSAFILMYFIMQLISNFFYNVFIILGDVCVVAVFGWIAARLLRS